MTTASIYIRVSSGPQETNGTSLQSQEELCRAYAQQHGYTVPPEYFYREVHTGTELWERPQLSLLREAIRHKQIQVVVVYAIDRLTRDPVHLGVLITEADHAGVEVEFVTEPLDNTPEGQLIRFVRGYAARVENEQRRERSLRGKRAVILSGKIHNHGVDLYGYKRDKPLGVRVIYEPEAKVVRDIFAWMVEDDLGTRAIARRLTQLEVPSPSAGKMAVDKSPTLWCKTQIGRIIQHPCYKGETIEWRWSQHAKPRPQSDWIPLPPNVTPAIVSPELWHQANDHMKNQRGHAKRNEKSPFLLRGVVVCAVCGHAMSPGARRNYVTYRCASRQTTLGKCEAKPIPVKLLEDWAWEQVSRVLRDPGLIRAERERRQTEGADQRTLADREAAQRSLAKVERQQEKLIRKYRESEDDAFPWELIEREISRAESEKKQFQETISKLDQLIDEEHLALTEMETLEYYCRKVGQNLDAFDFDDKRLALSALQVKVVAVGRDPEKWYIRGAVPLEMPSGVVATTC